jgi:hypothetical protein
MWYDMGNIEERQVEYWKDLENTEEKCDKIWKIWKIWKKSIVFYKTINTACNLFKFTLCPTVSGNNYVYVYEGITL